MKDLVNKKTPHLIEYLNPADWSLHVIDGEDVAVLKNWVLVPEGVEKFIHLERGVKGFYKDDFLKVWIDDQWENTHNDKDNIDIWNSRQVLWQRNTQHDNVNHPSHYTQGGIECIEAIKASMSHEAFCGYLKGNVQKYMWRYEHKGGVESLKKAQWYLDRLVKELDGEG